MAMAMSVARAAARVRLMTGARLVSQKAGEGPTSINTTAREAPRVAVEEAFKPSTQVQHDQGMKKTITVRATEDLSTCVGVPPEHIHERMARIYRPSKNAMQSGSATTKRWKIEFETRERWENPLMGWASSGDPLSNMQIDFATKEEAITFANKHGYPYFIEIPNDREPKAKSYALNFAWKKRTRKSTK
jgi:NADH dehydrogenase (ubiquinone) Fe-S protein 4